ncbi:MAG: hypothetical protein K940chlam3_00428 [Chlamydiae bacterium]|nr:hypothetical protein [Chlamydiota bacterium]
MMIFFLFIPFAISAHDKFILVTVPKCGSHLIIHVLYEMLHKNDQRQLRSDYQDFLHELMIAERRGTYLSTHQPSSQEAIEFVKDHGYKVIFIIRDPRDQLVSLMYYNQQGYWPQLPISQLSQSEQIEELITGNCYGYQAYEDCFSNRLGWIDLGPEITYVTTFEKLIGIHGGGSDELQMQEIMNIGAHIGVSLLRKRCQKIAQAAYGKGVHVSKRNDRFMASQFF